MKLCQNHMMHGLCDPMQRTALSMEKGKFVKLFPKSYNEKTHIDENEYQIYKRKEIIRSVYYIMSTVPDIRTYKLIISPIHIFNTLFSFFSKSTHSSPKHHNLVIHHNLLHGSTLLHHHNNEIFTSYYPR